MDPNTGKLYLFDDPTLDEEFKESLIEVKRTLTPREALEMEIKKYSPCACGSGQKFAFCCFRKKEGRA